MYTLVIIDDEQEIHSGLSKYFPWNEVNFEVVNVFEDGRSALKYLSRNSVDIVLSDIMMPDLTGLELASKLKEINFSGKVVFLSGYKNFEFAQKAIELGVRYYILKPTRYQQVIEVFTKLRDELDSANAKASPGGTENALTNRSVIESIKKYMEEHYNTTTLADTASFIGMNPFYLSKYFKVHTGQNYIDYLLTLRMKNAADMLKSTSCKIFEISGLVGYGTSKSFTREFRKYFGVSPRQYRNESCCLSLPAKS